VLDTIPLRFERRRHVRFAKRLFLRIACLLSTRIITISAWSRDSIVRDLGVPRAKLTVTSLAVDPRRVSRIRALRAASARSDQVVYVGRFAEHKNLHRLCRAFQSTAFRASGGRLVLVGGSPHEVASMSSWVTHERIAGVEVLGECSESELDRLLATCRALIQPSLEEGYGLPAVEAAAVGIQVAASRAGYAPEIPEELVTFMDPLDESSIASAVDKAIARPDTDVTWLPSSTLARDVLLVLRDMLAGI
jgi:glycosyltransferase involved in cell wall biosynthesis